MHTIAIVPGDGIGSEIMKEAEKVLKKVTDFKYEHALIGGAAYDKYQDHFPEATKQICQNADAILFGSVGGPVNEQDNPKWEDCEKKSILGIRQHFNFSINYRPVKVYDGVYCVLRDDILNKGIDIFCVRELSGGIYFGEHKTDNQVATDTMIYDADVINDVAVSAFEAAMKRNKKLTSVDKANVLDCSRLWRKVVNEVAKNYPEVEYEHMFVDNAAMQVVKRPYDFDVLLMPNMFGDIISDLVSVFAGSLGMLPSASINKDGFAMYEPAGGSAPDIAGRGIANPIGQILSAAMMLKYSFNMHREHDAILAATEEVLRQGVRTPDLGGSNSTQEVGDAICNFLTK